MPEAATTFSFAAVMLVAAMAPAMLAVMALRSIVESRSAGGCSAARCFRQEALLPLCYATARVMVRVVILAALYGMVIPFAYYGVAALEVLLS